MTIYIAIVMFLSLIMSYTDAVKLRRIYFIIITLSLGILGMLYDPITGLNDGMYTDLYRIFNELNMFRFYGWHADTALQGTVNMTTNYGPIIIAKIYMYLCARISSNNSILPLINTIITYGAMALGLTCVGKKINANNVMISSAFVFFILINDYSRVVTNIRMPLAMALFALVWCKQINSGKKKLWHYIAYGLICLIHSAMFIFFAIKLIVDFMPKKSINIFIVLMLVSSLFLNSLINLLNHFSGAGAMISGLLQKVLLYSEDGTKVGIMALKSNSHVVILNLFRMAFFLFLIYLLKKVINGEKSVPWMNSEIVSLRLFGELITAFALGSLWSFHLFNRTVSFMVMLIPIYILIIAQYDNIRVLPLKRLNVLSVVTWIFTIVSVMYYFIGFSYNQLVF